MKQKTLTSILIFFIILCLLGSIVLLGAFFFTRSALKKLETSQSYSLTTKYNDHIDINIITKKYNNEKRAELFVNGQQLSDFNLNNVLKLITKDNFFDDPLELISQQSNNDIRYYVFNWGEITSQDGGKTFKYIPYSAENTDSAANEQV